MHEEVRMSSDDDDQTTIVRRPVSWHKLGCALHQLLIIPKTLQYTNCERQCDETSSESSPDTLCAAQAAWHYSWRPKERVKCTIDDATVSYGKRRPTVNHRRVLSETRKIWWRSSHTSRTRTIARTRVCAQLVSVSGDRVESGAIVVNEDSTIFCAEPQTAEQECARSRRKCAYKNQSSAKIEMAKVCFGKQFSLTRMKSNVSDSHSTRHLVEKRTVIKPILMMTHPRRPTKATNSEVFSWISFFLQYRTKCVQI